MAAVGIGHIDEYINFLKLHTSEVELLAKDFLINVTRFFRDPSAFKSLSEAVIAELVDQVGEEPIRVWTPACSTGEEAYSIAMLFLEAFFQVNKRPRLMVFATDIADDALEIAREGIYPETITADVSPDRLHKFFIQQDHGYRVTRELRDVVLFSSHDLLIDPPFSRLDLVSCRNLLIYLEPEEQRRVLSLFHFALKDPGFLFLGASETIGFLIEFFQPVAQAQRIFKRIGPSHPGNRFMPASRDRLRFSLPRPASRTEPRQSGISHLVQRLLLKNYAPAAILVDRNNKAIYFSGPTDLYFQVNPGEPNSEAVTMLREGLTPGFRAAIRQANREHAPASVNGVQIKRHEITKFVTITAIPVRHEADDLTLVTFSDEPDLKSPASPLSYMTRNHNASLEKELEVTRKELENTIRELEESNQELSATNEEALSINEEFQSINEELETSREELQSLNEEMITTNNQLQEALEKQRQTSDDLQNILNSSDAATLFLDEELNVRFFTPSAAAKFNLIATDMGRPLADLANPFLEADLILDAKNVLADLIPVRREVKTSSGAWYTYRITPYRTQDNRIEGVVISISEISTIKAVEEQIQAARTYAEKIIDTVHEPLIVLDENMQILSASKSYYELFHTQPDLTIGKSLPDSDHHHLDIKTLRTYLDRVKEGNAPVTCEITVNTGDLKNHVFVVRVKAIQDDATGKRILVSMEDITEFRKSESDLALARNIAEQANKAKSHILNAASHDLRQPLQSLHLFFGALQNMTVDPKMLQLLDQASNTARSMSQMLKAILDINSLESGVIKPQQIDFPINQLLVRLYNEFAHLASQREVTWRIVQCKSIVFSDPALLEQMVRNLIANAFKYTNHGKVLLGCRHIGSRTLRLEVWDTGVGISDENLPRIFDEYHQIAGEGAVSGLGLGLSIVQRLGELLKHPVGVRSWLGKGSVFSMDIPISQLTSGLYLIGNSANRSEIISRKKSSVFLIEDDLILQDALVMSLRTAGYRIASASSAGEALRTLADGFYPDVLLVDISSHARRIDASTGKAMKGILGRIPIIFLTNDFKASDFDGWEAFESISLTKPVTTADLVHAIDKLVVGSAIQTRSPLVKDAGKNDGLATIYVVDDDIGVGLAIRELLSSAGYLVECFSTPSGFLSKKKLSPVSCLITDVRMPEMNGIEFIDRLSTEGIEVPSIVITGEADIPMAVKAIRAGAIDFIEKPVDAQALLSSVKRALGQFKNGGNRHSWVKAAANRAESLTKRERQVLSLIVAGHANKEIAARIHISQRTVEAHRASVMKKMHAHSLAELVRLDIALRELNPSVYPD